MDLDQFLNQLGEWLRGVGPDSDIVISSRIRLARNLKDYPFVNRMSYEEKEEVWQLVSHKMESVEEELSRDGFEGSSFLHLSLGDMSLLEREFLVERHLISRDLAEGYGPRGVILDSSERLSIMVNEEDHLRLQAIRSGFQLDELWDDISRLDDELEKRLPFAFHNRFGYLTACPTNVGTGMRVSVMLHLPALVMTKQIKRVLMPLQSTIGLTVRGLYGEWSHVFGDLYQISNGLTLGRSEGDLIQAMQKIVPHIVEHERNVRKALLEDIPVTLEDRIWRAFGMLQFARTMTSQEAMDLLSAVRMGVHLNILDDLPLETVSQLFLLVQPAHLQKLEGRELEESERDVLRARFIREKLNSRNGK